MTEYSKLNHTREVSGNGTSELQFYLPRHAVINTYLTTTSHNVQFLTQA